MGITEYIRRYADEAIDCIETRPDEWSRLIDKVIENGTVGEDLRFSYAATYRGEALNKMKANNILYFYGIVRIMRELMQKTEARLRRSERGFSQQAKKAINAMCRRHGFLSLKTPELKKMNKQLWEFDSLLGDSLEMSAAYFDLKDLVRGMQRNNNPEDLRYKADVRRLLHICVSRLNDTFEEWIDTNGDYILPVCNAMKALVNSMVSSNLSPQLLKQECELNRKQHQNPDGSAIGTELSRKFLRTLQVLRYNTERMEARVSSVNQNNIPLRKSLAMRKEYFGSLIKAIEQIEERTRAENVSDHGELTGTSSLKGMIKEFESFDYDGFSMAGTEFIETYRDKIDAINTSLNTYATMVKTMVGIEDYSNDLHDSINHINEMFSSPKKASAKTAVSVTPAESNANTPDKDTVTEEEKSVLIDEY